MQFMHKTMLALPLLAAVPVVMPYASFGVPLAPHERSALTTSAPQLEQLRAGATTRMALGADERAILRQAEQRNGALANLRAGALTQQETLWILLGIAIVILIIVA